MRDKAAEAQGLTAEQVKELGAENGKKDIMDRKSPHFRKFKDFEPSIFSVLIHVYSILSNVRSCTRRSGQSMLIPVSSMYTFTTMVMFSTASTIGSLAQTVPCYHSQTTLISFSLSSIFHPCVFAPFLQPHHQCQGQTSVHEISKPLSYADGKDSQSPTHTTQLFSKMSRCPSDKQQTVDQTDFCVESGWNTRTGIPIGRLRQ
ncbi:hypothetical protein DFH05DRAFT_1465421 [Lentinula detonsa]|uniref:Uncharacterized protein n=1 Tax=Lentinula detonsa TaxID=2804962 RepID=A0A9W8PA14_9AGAR|nr:hypothetical protein DFH05DRAFT_1465421 [Lentinula detonsa]